MVKDGSSGKSSQRGERNRSQKGRIEQPVSAGGVVYRVSDGTVETVLCGRRLLTCSPQKEELPAGHDIYEGRLRKSVTKDGKTIDQLLYAIVRE